jgi:drug/metabolite transporter (DMT)-like permease
MNVAFLSAMIFTTAGNTIWLQHTAPVWVLLLSVLVLREKIAPRSLLLIAFGMSGVAVILAGELSTAATVTGGRQGLGVLLALASGLTYALVVLFLRALRSEDSAWLIVVNLLVTAAILAPLVVFLAISRDVRPTWTQLAVLACFGLFQLGLPYVLFARGLRVTTSGEAAGMVLIEPLLTPLWVFLVWGEASRWWTIVGGALILTGLTINLLRAPRSPVAKS